ncbi:sulfurtransferase complex subunit TusD [Colwellia sp. MB02u-18]|uniref:sulfurtransferase complex subunit TusD n=1 Tax=unclassified Colwellia TaxID=196834 RepID=UPI0015F511B5|nr:MULTISPECIES: sulfurtransferase complex subunit TusD [unclassified Colwellia]MBA6224833.1 sulfurtransferase complex subunit TusD [Colwellia sp. MB3u-45]MBA6268879.1 sulfurtransferase complex subunit TusD [Colwellia sp. MB3u-43]MBA6321310.1 sulfurtransferase complex subunit TusD [Colwellia sp. MB02u-19]MBA6325863.1 sulfurtransferase complex subunit TusD [Colwellia sp. MB02u-18]MBA6332338.1 sulfurtransferase complex subunit TusD [Colwellia sp. MB02u-12]
MQNRLALVVTTPPSSNLTTTAINLVRAALDSGVSIVGVFFYQDGVLNAAKYLSIPSDEFQTLAQWQQLNSEYNVPLYLCITAAEKRGLSDELNNHESSNIDSAFTVSGLGELVELTSKAERVVQL